ncbi:MAG: hypothetical protein RR981_05080 [Oscillospiraceae bacterium]
MSKSIATADNPYYYHVDNNIPTTVGTVQQRGSITISDENPHYTGTTIKTSCRLFEVGRTFSQSYTLIHLSLKGSIASKTTANFQHIPLLLYGCHDLKLCRFEVHLEI